ncbi:polysaccharide lyase family protein [Kribbella solani]|uniref:polysaccharide lyase family protein n=1 Tax=Kribbella solani TaxID=236067 RepID=UPI0029B94C28|nr:polysaccharide lyase family protein [Kribbella solani]MDX2972079.1 polysaccharide lyase family protein [Kribbella solani]MDX3002965.1 polysaccharide lyase family protein [Kribbella solani]
MTENTAAGRARPNPPAITGLGGTGDIGTATLSWTPVPWAIVVDHYAVQVSIAGSPWTPLAKTVYPHFVHRGLGFTGVTRSYRIVTVDAAGNVSAPSAAADVANKTSVTVSGTPIAWVGSFDGKGEFALTPNKSAQYPVKFPNDVDYTYPTSVPTEDWCYLMPGPADKWAGSKNHQVLFRFDLPEAPAKDLDLALWLIDSHAKIPGSAVLSVNGTTVDRLTFLPGATKGSTISDSTLPNSPLKPSYLERPLSKDLFKPGQNVIQLLKDNGSWIAFDAFGIYGRP